jgi:hypothetical protein
MLAHGAVGWLVLSGNAADGGPQTPRREFAAMQLVASTRLTAGVQAPRHETSTTPVRGNLQETPWPAPSASAPNRPPPAPERIAPQVAVFDTFRAPVELDRAALPRSAPDIATLSGLPWSGLPMRLRLFIDAAGSVVSVMVLQAYEDDEVVERVRQMFLATAFVAGRLEGEDVASYKDVELTIGPTR